MEYRYTANYTPCVNVYSDYYSFSAKRKEFKTLGDFGYACVFQEYQRTVDFLRESAEKHGLSLKIPSWETFREPFGEQLVSAHIFWEKLRFYFTDYLREIPDIPEESIQAAMIMQEEWNSVLVVAQLADAYVGYWWMTGV